MGIWRGTSDPDKSKGKDQGPSGDKMDVWNVEGVPDKSEGKSDTLHTVTPEIPGGNMPEDKSIRGKDSEPEKKGILHEYSKAWFHIIMVAITVFVIAAIILIVPTSRVWCLGEITGTGVKVIGSDELGAVVTNAVDNLDTTAVAEIVNDYDNRTALVEFISELLPELDAAKTADMVNDLVEDENLSLFIVELIPQLDPAAVADLVNTILADESTSTLVNDLIVNLNEIGATENIAVLVNNIVAAPGTAELANGLIAGLETENLATLVDSIVAAPGTIELVNGLVAGLDAHNLAILVNEIVAEPATAELVNGLVESLDTENLAILVNSILGANNAQNISKLVSDLITNLYAVGAQDNIAILVNDIVANPILEPFLISLIGQLDGAELGKFLTPILSNPTTVGLLEDLLGELAGEDGSLGSLINALNGPIDGEPGILKQVVLPNLWLHIDVESVGLLGDAPDWFITLIDGLDIKIWARIHDLHWSPADEPPYLTEEQQVENLIT